MPSWRNLAGASHRRWPRLIAGLVAVAVVGGGAFAFYRHTRRPLVPDAVRRQVSFQLYYPANLPDGLAVDPNSFTSPAKGVVVFAISAGAGRINVSEQARPSDAQLNVGTFLKTNVNEATEFLSQYGQATVGNLSDGERFGTLVADTWIIVTAPARVELGKVRTVVAAMGPLAA